MKAFTIQDERIKISIVITLKTGGKSYDNCLSCFTWQFMFGTHQ